MNTNIQSYSLTKAYKNGNRVLLNENAAKYDGHSLSMIENHNGKVKFAKIDNDDMLDLLLKHQEKAPLLQRLEHDFPITSRHHHRRSHTKKMRSKSKSKSKSKSRSKSRSRSRRKSHTHRRHKTKSFEHRRTRKHKTPSILKTIY